MSTADRTGRRGGFTLIELLIVVVLAGILATVVFQLFLGQSQFTSTQSAREEVDQNTRGALELISSELRAVPSGAIVEATATKVSVRLPRVWGITCVPSTAAGVVALFPGGSTPADYTSATGTALANWGVGVQRDAALDVYDFATISAKSAALGACIANTEVTGVNEAGSVQPVRTDLPDARAFVLTGAITANIPVGNRVFLYQTITYDLGTASGDGGTWLRRTVGSGTPQPLAGPLLTDSAGLQPLQFVYRCLPSPTSAASVPYSDLTAANLQSGLARVNTIEVQLVMRSRDATTKQRQIRGDTLAVHLRNSGTTCT